MAIRAFTPWLLKLLANAIEGAPHCACHSRANCQTFSGSGAEKEIFGSKVVTNGPGIEEAPRHEAQDFSHSYTFYLL